MGGANATCIHLSIRHWRPLNQHLARPDIQSSLDCFVVEMGEAPTAQQLTLQESDESNQVYCMVKQSGLGVENRGADLMGASAWSRVQVPSDVG